jgi:hypothetical protein
MLSKVISVSSFKKVVACTHRAHHAEGLVNPKVRALKKGY